MTGRVPSLVSIENPSHGTSRVLSLSQPPSRIVLAYRDNDSFLT